MSALKVLVLVHHDCVPPEGATIQSADWAHWKTEYYVKKTLTRLGHQVRLFPVTDQLTELQTAITEFKPDVAFNLLEEFKGEAHFESHVVAFLELLGVPCTGCNPLGLALGRDKATSKKIVQYHGIPTPGFFTVPIGKKLKKPQDLNYPLIVKSLSEEASLGISQQSVVMSFEALQDRVAFIHKNLQTAALVEEYIEGREIYVGVLGNKQLRVLHPWELKFGELPQKGFPIATRNVKFNKVYTDRHQIVRGPAQDLNPHTLKKIETFSREIFRHLKLSGYARLDFRVTESGEVCFLEANPNPELAKTECFANGADASGLKYDELLEKILKLSRSFRPAA